MQFHSDADVTEDVGLFEAAAHGRNDLPVARLLAVSKVPVTCFA